MRRFSMDFVLQVPESTKDKGIELFDSAFIDLAEGHGLGVVGSLVEIDENYRRLDGFKTQEERLTIYDQVNKCESLSALANAIRSLADKDGNIEGRTKTFSAERMAGFCEIYDDPSVPRNTLTREYGIRQQAMYIIYYKI